MRNVPIIRVFTALLGQINARALRSQSDGFIGNIISGLSDAFRTVAPVN